MLIYRFIPHLTNAFDFQLLQVPQRINEFLEEQKVFVTEQGVSFYQFGNKLILDDGDIFVRPGSMGTPLNIIIPDTRDRRIYDTKGLEVHKAFNNPYNVARYCRCICSSFAALWEAAECDMNHNRCRGDPYLIIMNKS